jgi:hypothetical protein
MDGSTSASRQQRLHNPVRRRRRDAASQRGLVMMIRTALLCLGPGGAGAFEIRQSPRRNPAADEVADHCRGRVSQSDMCVAPAQASFQWCSAMILQALWPVWEREELRVDTFPAGCDSALPCLAPRAGVSVFPSLSASRSTKQTRLSSTSGKAGLAERFLRHDAKRRDITVRWPPVPPDPPLWVAAVFFSLGFQADAVVLFIHCGW